MFSAVTVLSLATGIP